MDTPFFQDRPQDEHPSTGRLCLPRNFTAELDDDVYALGAVDGDCCAPEIASSRQITFIMRRGPAYRTRHNSILATLNLWRLLVSCDASSQFVSDKARS